MANAKSNKAQALAPVRFFNPLSMRFAKHATREDIDEVVAQHARAVRYAIDAGFDAVEIHLGHNYLASSFLSPLVNKRSDEFGGSLANRQGGPGDRDGGTPRGGARRRGTDRGDRQAQHGRRVRGGIGIEVSLQTARWLQDDSGLMRSNSPRAAPGQPDVPVPRRCAVKEFAAS